MTGDCKICDHPKSEHKSHIGPDWTGEKIKHIGCRVIVKRDKVDMKEIGITSIGHNCSCHGVKPNTSLKAAIKKYTKYIKDNKATISPYKVKKLRDTMRRFRKDIKENPKNLLHWQLELENV